MVTKITQEWLALYSYNKDQAMWVLVEMYNELVDAHNILAKDVIQLRKQIEKFK